MSKIYWSWKNIRESLRRIWQNITRGWNDSDCWSLDVTIAKFVLPRLKRLKEMKHGVPSMINVPDLPKDITDDEKFKLEQIEWNLILDKMIRSFEYLVNDKLDVDCPMIAFKFVDCEDKKYSRMEYDAPPEKIKEHKKEMKIYMKKRKLLQKEIDEGLMLFAKYFQSLWD